MAAHEFLSEAFACDLHRMIPTAAPGLQEAAERVTGVAAARGGTGLRLAVMVLAPDGSCAGFGCDRMRHTPVRVLEPDSFPYEGAPPPDGTTLLVTLTDDGSPRFEVRVDVLEDGLAQGIARGRPAIVCVTPAGAVSTAYAHRGADVTDMVRSPPRSLGDTGREDRGWVEADLFPDPCHPAIVSLGQAAEDRGEGIIISSDAHPGLNALLGPGEGGYTLVNPADATRILAAWSAAGVPCVRIARKTTEACSEVALIRRVAGRIHGPTPDMPGVCVSRVDWGSRRADVRTVLFDHGRRLVPGLVGRVNAIAEAALTRLR